MAENTKDNHSLTRLYGLKNCDSTQKTIKYLEKNNIAFNFHDFRKDGIDLSLVNEFLTHIEFDQLVNKRSTTYRSLPDDIKANLSADNIGELLVEQPTLIKRPVLIHDQQYSVGFKEAQYQQIFKL